MVLSRFKKPSASEPPKLPKPKKEEESFKLQSSGHSEDRKSVV